MKKMHTIRVVVTKEKAEEYKQMAKAEGFGRSFVITIPNRKAPRRGVRFCLEYQNVIKIKKDSAITCRVFWLCN